MTSVSSIQQSLRSWCQEQHPAVRNDFYNTQRLPLLIESWFDGAFMFDGPPRDVRYVKASRTDWESLRKTFRFVSVFSPPSRYHKLFRFQLILRDYAKERLPAAGLLRNATLSFPKPVQSFTASKAAMIEFAIELADFDKGDIGGFIAADPGHQNILADSLGIFNFLVAVSTDKSLPLSGRTRAAFKDAEETVREFLHQEEVIVDCESSLRGDVVLKAFDRDPTFVHDMVKTIKPLIAKL